MTARKAAPKADAAPKATWLTPVSDVWERRYGKGTAPHGKLAKALAPLLPHHSPEAMAAHLDGYLEASKGREQFINLFTFAATFATWAPKHSPPTGPAVEDGWMTDEFERATRP